ncbi:MAG: potassium channel family protein [Magnetococcales bacterium]|nr:potassium channel family protein [Magnetococcales bacterium]NGZ28041.1 potassium channel family protein [Magnetococcales bacterium]
MPRLRTVIFNYVSPHGWNKEGLSPVNHLLLLAVAVAVVSQILETEQALYREHATFFTWLEFGVGALFTLDYLTRIWVAAEMPQYQGWWGRLRYALTPVALCDLLASLPFLLYFIFEWVGINDLAVLRLFQAFKLIRAANLGRFSEAARALQHAIRIRGFELLLSLILAILMALLTATCLYWVEGDVQPKAFGSIPRALWWSIETLTTVGYGDVIPVTPLGRLLAGIFAFLGIGIIALPTGILASAFSDALHAKRSTQSTDKNVNSSSS